MGVVAFAGSRGLSPAFSKQVSQVVTSVSKSGRSISVGCCVGLDQFVVGSPCAVASVHCFAIFSQYNSGACNLSASDIVSKFSMLGGKVDFSVGGNGNLKSRLSNRTHAVINSATISTVVFFNKPNSIGSLLACRLSVRRGLSVFAFACGFSGSALPSLGSGSWVSVGGSGLWSGSWRWVSSQSSIF